MHVLSLPPAFVLSQDQTLRLKEDHLAYRSSMITGGHCQFLGILRVLKVARLRSGGDLRFYRATRNRTAEVFASCVAARAPELRRPRFSFLYHQLVKEPDTGRRSRTGGERAPLLSQQLRTTDRIDQLETLKIWRLISPLLKPFEAADPHI